MDIDYLIQAIKIVVSGQLKENHDDTLIEKLISLVERNVEDGIFTRSDEMKILPVLTDSLDIDEPEPTCFRLVAIILADLYISYGLSSDEEELERAFVAFITASKMISSSSELSLQSSFIKSYAYIKKITELMRNSSSYYVRSEAERLLIELLLNNQASVESDTSNKLRIELKKIVEVPTETNLNFLKRLSAKTFMTRSLIRMEVRDKLFGHFKTLIGEADPSESQVISCLEVLGSLVPKPSVVESVIGSLVKSNRLKALIVFTSTLMKSDRDHLNKWMQYSLYTLVCKSESKFEVTSQILISVRERNFIEKLCNDSIILCILTRIPSVIQNIDERESLLLETLQILLTDELKKKNKNRKIISEAISCLKKLLEEGISPDRNIINVICELIPLSSGHHLIELLIICRNFYNRVLPREVVGIDKICKILNKIFQCHLKEDQKGDRNQLYGDRDPETEVLEAAVQVLGVISCSPSISSKLQLIKSFQLLFTKCSGDLAFLTSSIPVLFSVNFELSQEQLAEIFGWEKNVDIIKLLCSYLTAEDSSLLQLKVLQTLKDEAQFERVSFLQTFRLDMFFKNLVPALCQCVISSVDTETQVIVISLITSLFQFPNEGMIQLLYSSSVLDLLFFIIENKDGTFPRNLRIGASDLVITLKNSIKDTTFDQNLSLKELLQKVEPPQECTKNQDFSQEVCIIPVPVSEKVEKIEQLFNNSVNQPTMDLIEELNKRETNGHTMPEETRRKKMKITRTIHDLDELVTFYTSSCNRLIHDDDPEEDSLIIDDIIAAQIRPNVATSDCY